MPPPARVACVCGREGGRRVCACALFTITVNRQTRGKRGEGGRAGAALRAWRVWRRRAAATPAAVKEENERAGERAGPKNGGGGFTAFKEKRKRGERTSDG